MDRKLSLHINERKVTYLDQGQRGDPVVLLLHGFPESSLIWEEVIPTITSCGFRAVAPDFPGFGDSEQLDTATWENYLIFVTDFINKLEVEKFHLFVHDWGGLIGLQWACEHPQQVLSFIINSTTFTATYEWHGLAQLFRSPKGEATITRMANKEAWQARMKEMVPRVTQEMLDDFYKVIHTKDVPLELYRSGDMDKLIPYEGRLKGMNKPATILCGEKDPYIPVEAMYRLRDVEFPKTKVHVLQDAGHFLQVEVPECVNHWVKIHLQNLKKG
jgi:haloalkane dehalogenase